MQLESMSLEELKQLRKDVEKAITTFEDRRLREAREKIEAVAREMGVTLSEIMDVSTKGKSVNPAKYRHPENPELTWTGRGRKPGWIVEALERGESLETYEI